MINPAELHDQLQERAFLHNDPDAYRAGVEDALRLLHVEIALPAPEEQTAGA